MSFKLTIKNFGKLSDEEINIGRFTVFAGPNNTGKSFVSKLLYSLFDGMNVNHALVHFDILTNPLRRNLSSLQRWERLNNEDLQLSVLNGEIHKIRNLVESLPIDDSEKIEDQWNQITYCTKELRERYKEFKKNIDASLQNKQKLSSFSDLPNFITKTLNRTEESLEKLCKKVEETCVNKFIEKGVQYKIFRNLTQNFQVPTLLHLRKIPENPSEILIDGVGKFNFENGDLVDFRIEQSDFQQLQDYSRVIYLESPVYWKLKPALERVRTSPRFLDNLEDMDRLSGVAGYFHDSVWALEERYSGDIAFADLYKNLISKEVIGGKLTISETGELRFQEDGRSFSLHVTAMGVINLGLLALLIERNIIRKHSFVFIDEPEAHLHTSWQVEIAKTLLELSRLGVNIVIATHSAEILEFLKVEAEKDVESEELIALNHFSYNGVKNYGGNFKSGIENIQEELTDPFSKLYLAGL